MTRHTDPKHRLRHVTPEDLPRLHRLDLEVFGDFGYPYYVLRQWFDAHGDSFLVADSPDSSELLGYVMVAADPATMTSWLIGIGVAAGHRGLGLGSLLLEAAVEHSATSGMRQMKITVHPGNLVARSLYSKHGFQWVAEEEDYFGRGEARAVLARSLPLPERAS